MRGALEAAGFDVMLIENADYRRMHRAIVDFGDKLNVGAVGLFYYSGHGIQFDGANYMVPVDAELSKKAYAKSEAVNLNDVLDRMGAAGNGLNIVVLDACRNNPFPAFAKAASRGLAVTQAPGGTYIAYATAPNDVATDGDGRNSPFTVALAQTLALPGLELDKLFKAVRTKVYNATGKRQLPWSSSSVQGDFYFHAPLKTAAVNPPPGPSGAEESKPVLARDIDDQLRDRGRTRRGWLGVSIQTVTAGVVSSFGLDKARGALVSAVSEGGHQAGRCDSGIQRARSRCHADAAAHRRRDQDRQQGCGETVAARPDSRNGRGDWRVGGGRKVKRLDIYRSANILVSQHGDDAPIHSAMRADDLLEKGDMDGYAVWKRIVETVKRAIGQGAQRGRALALPRSRFKLLSIARFGNICAYYRCGETCRSAMLRMKAGTIGAGAQSRPVGSGSTTTRA